MKKQALVTVIIGEKYKKIYDTYFRSSQEDYARRMDTDLIIISDYIDRTDFGRSRHSAWQKLLIFEAPETQNYERLCWIDADIYITKKAKDPFDFVPPDKWGAVKNNPYELPSITATESTIYEKYGWPKETQPKYLLNTGMFIVEKNKHSKTLRYIYDNYKENKLYENIPLSYHILNEKFFLLDFKFNSLVLRLIRRNTFFWPIVASNAYFVHFAGNINRSLVNAVKIADKYPFLKLFSCIFALYTRIKSKVKRALIKPFT